MEITQVYFNKWTESITDAAAEKAANKAVEKHAEETKRYMEDLKKFFSEEAAKAGEIANSRTTETRVREIFAEEIKPFARDIELIKNEIGQINSKLDKIIPS